MSSNLSRIAKNTLILYIRQIIIILISLYTVRLKLEILGVEDFGIYNIVAGLVIFFSFFSEAMANSTQRFLNFALGQNNTEQARDAYSCSLVIHLFTSLAIIVIAETLGLWLFFNWLNIPLERRTIALIVYQFSIITTAVNIFRIPYFAAIIAYEKISYLSLISTIECILKLLIVILLKITFFDKLAVYSFLFFITGIIILSAYKIYCNKKFSIAHFRYCRDKELFSKIIGFSGWNFFGSFANVSSSHGLNILINIFHGVIANAAMGIATQVKNSVYQFINNFQTAFRPQLIKSYAAKEFDYLNKLVYQTSKISFYLLLLFILPLYINADFVLKIWLKNVPEYAIVFTRLMLLNSFEGAIIGPLIISIQATGNIKKFQLVTSIFSLTNLPVSFMFLNLGFDPVWVLIIRLTLSYLSLFWSITYISKKIGISILQFIKNVIVPISLITCISSIITLFSYNFFSDWTRLLLTCFTSTLSILFLVYFVGLNRSEKTALVLWIKNKINRPAKTP